MPSFTEITMIIAFIAMIIIYRLVFKAMANRLNKLPIEENLKPLYQKTHSGRIGTGLYMKGPFIELRIYEAFVVISAWNQHLLYYSEIEELKTVTNGRSKLGIEFVHRKADVPELSVLVYGRKQEELKALLQERLPISEG